MNADKLEQKMLEGLEKLACQLRGKEINFAIYSARFRTKDGRMASDVPFLAAANTLGSSQIVYDGHGHYDVWSSDGRKMVSSNMSCEQATELVLNEYYTAKAVRVMQREPHHKFDVLMDTRIKGYQNK